MTDPVFFRDGPPKVATSTKAIVIRLVALFVLVSGILAAGLTQV